MRLARPVPEEVGQVAKDRAHGVAVGARGDVAVGPNQDDRRPPEVPFSEGMAGLEDRPRSGAPRLGGRRLGERIRALLQEPRAWTVKLLRR